jgi:hypothetical protein
MEKAMINRMNAVRRLQQAPRCSATSKRTSHAERQRFAVDRLPVPRSSGRSFDSSASQTPCPIAAIPRVSATGWSIYLYHVASGTQVAVIESNAAGNTYTLAFSALVHSNLRTTDFGTQR